MNLTESNCPVCSSSNTVFVRTVPTRRTKTFIPLYECLACHSFWNLSSYKEDDLQLQRDLQWGIGVADRNRNAGKRLLDKLEACGASLTSILEVGCGIGTLLTVARSRGSNVTGFDINQMSINYAKEINMLDAHCRVWSSTTMTPPVSLYLSISVLEHMARPRPLIHELCKAASLHAASLFISVPFFEERHRQFLSDPDPYRPGTLFCDNDVHVTHFSILGLEKVLRSEGRNNINYIEAGLWNGILSLPNGIIS